ncbi:MAG: amidohydrolase [Chloroflexi bacterium]|nr:amidohydrolase [Chloroflexota bacterium]
MTILIENGIILTLAGAPPAILDPGYVLIQDDRIAAIGPGDAPHDLRAAADQIMDATHMAVLPGLVNAHTHLFQTFIRGLADDKPLLPWLAAAIWPMGAAMGAEEAYLAGLLGLVENIRSGATAVIDNQYLHSDDRTDDAFCRAARDVGCRFTIARGWADHDYHPVFQETPEQVIAAMTALHDAWHGAAEGRIRIAFGPLIPWGCSAETLQRTVALARQWGVPTHLHTAETREEVQMSLDATGLRHVHWLDRLGILGPDLQLVHAVWLDDSEIERIAATGTMVIHCPVSNMYLASGIAPIVKLLRAGVPVALATDGPGSNNSQDMLETLKFAACGQKVGTLDATALLPEDVLRMACVYGAQAVTPALGPVSDRARPSSGRSEGGSVGDRPQQQGLIPGAKADLILVDLNSPRMQPVWRVPSALVYNANGGDVDTVIVDGRVLMRGKRVTCLDEAALLDECRRAAKSLLKRAGVAV